MMNLLPAKLVRRYKRFLADVILPDGQQITVHCPNTGSMKNCQEPGADIWLSESPNPKRKYRYTWELITTSRGHTIGINTSRANDLVEQAIIDGKIVPLTGYEQLRREVKYGDENSRIDIFMSAENRADCYVEVKSVTLLEAPVSAGIGYFPDAISQRGAKHLRELMLMQQHGKRAVLFFCVQHTGIRQVQPADHIDQHYGELLRCAADAGVEVLAFKVRKTTRGLVLSRQIEVVL